MIFFAILRSIFGHMRVAKMALQKVSPEGNYKEKCLAGTKRQLLVETQIPFGYFQVIFCRMRVATMVLPKVSPKGN